jgi:hypothetical protein
VIAQKVLPYKAAKYGSNNARRLQAAHAEKQRLQSREELKQNLLVALSTFSLVGPAVTLRGFVRRFADTLNAENARSVAVEIADEITANRRKS